jgi:methionyl aminopeptidase
MHQPPDVPNLGRAGRGELLVKGMCIAIEPMITAGSAVTATLEDEWTVVTRDGSPAAHWEHTVALTTAGAWVLTAEDGGEAELAARGVTFGPLGDEMSRIHVVGLGAVGAA